MLGLGIVSLTLYFRSRVSDKKEKETKLVAFRVVYRVDGVVCFRGGKISGIGISHA